MVSLTLHAGDKHEMDVDWFGEDGVRRRESLIVGMLPQNKGRSLYVAVNERIVFESQVTHKPDVPPATPPAKRCGTCHFMQRHEHKNAACAWSKDYVLDASPYCGLWLKRED